MRVPSDRQDVATFERVSIRVNEENIEAGHNLSAVLKHVECLSYGVVLLAFEAVGPEPIRNDECPHCGTAEFEFVD